MRAVRGIGILNILLGLIALYLPVKFYSFASNLFTPEVSPPFSLGAIKVLTAFLFLPSIVLVSTGIALVTLGLKLERVPEYKAFSEAGEYLGRLKGVELEEGEVEKFDLGEGEKEEVLPGEQIVAMDDVVIVKKPEVEIGGVRHEFVEKEVYNEFGEYLGKVESVTLDKQGDLVEFLAVRGEARKVIDNEDIDSSNGVIIVKHDA
ncbi:MAG: PRC-barrel domain-containing protein [Candidatus Hydrothermarchaeaceae archaeon]